jgi:hypothetical protein
VQYCTVDTQWLCEGAFRVQCSEVGALFRENQSGCFCTVDPPHGSSVALLANSDSWTDTNLATTDSLGKVKNAMTLESCPFAERRCRMPPVTLSTSTRIWAPSWSRVHASLVSRRGAGDEGVVPNAGEEGGCSGCVTAVVCARGRSSWCIRESCPRIWTVNGSCPVLVKRGGLGGWPGLPGRRRVGKTAP